MIYISKLIMCDVQNTDDGLLEAIIEALRSDSISRDERERIADMLDPKSSRTNFRLKLFRRPGNRQQQDDEWLDRVYAFGAIYDALDGNEKEAISQAELPKEDGGMGVSRPTARKFLAAWKVQLSAHQGAD